MPLMEDYQKALAPPWHLLGSFFRRKGGSVWNHRYYVSLWVSPTLFQASNLLIAAVYGWGKHISPKHNIS